MRPILIALFVLLAFTGCRDYVKEGLHGSWTIESYKWKGQELINCLFVNMFSCKEEGCTLPDLFQDCDPSATRENGKRFVPYKIEEKGDRLWSLQFPESELPRYRGPLELSFWADVDNQKLHVLLQSEDLSVWALKVFFFFGEERALVNQISRKL